MSIRLAMFSIVFLLIAGCFTPATQAQGLFGKSPAKATLLSQQSSIQPGSTILLGVLLTPDEGWHTYWKNPGESGLPTKIQWELPDGFKAGDIQWPTPHEFEMSGILGLGYEGPALLTVPITAPAKITGDAITLKAKVSWLVCKEACIPGRASLSITLPVKDTTPQIVPANKDIFEKTLSQLPQQLDAKAYAVSIADHKLTITLNKMTLPHAMFYAGDESLVDLGSQQDITVKGNTTTITVTLSQYAPKTITQVRGIVVTNPHDKPPKSFAINAKINP
jgi:thiol:disulfide interchange protein DsbD